MKAAAALAETAVPHSSPVKCSPGPFLGSLERYPRGSFDASCNAMSSEACISVNQSVSVDHEARGDHLARSGGCPPSSASSLYSHQRPVGRPAVAFGPSAAGSTASKRLKPIPPCLSAQDPNGSTSPAYVNLHVNPPKDPPPSQQRPLLKPSSVLDGLGCTSDLPVPPIVVIGPILLHPTSGVPS